MLDDLLVLCLELPGSLILLVIEVSQHTALPIVLALRILNNLLLFVDSLLKLSGIKEAVNAAVPSGSLIFDLYI